MINLVFIVFTPGKGFLLNGEKVEPLFLCLVPLSGELRLQL
jgi:hypothetical protein